MYKNPPTKAKGKLFTVIYISGSLDKRSLSDSDKTNMVNDDFEFEVV